AETGIDALAVSLGQAHLHGRTKVELDIDRLRAIRQRVRVPLALHGATSVADDAIREVVRHGICKINVGSAVRTAFYEAVKGRIAAADGSFNPYEVLGSGLPGDVLLAGRLGVRDVVAVKMQLFGSAGHAR